MELMYDGIAIENDTKLEADVFKVFNSKVEARRHGAAKLPHADDHKQPFNQLLL